MQRTWVEWQNIASHGHSFVKYTYAYIVSILVRNLFLRYTKSLVRHDDTDLSISQVATAYYNNLSRIVKIHYSVTTAVCKSLIHGLVISRINYSNVMLYGITDRHQHHLLKIIQRSAADFIKQICLGERQSMTRCPKLRQLLWLPVRRRIEF